MINKSNDLHALANIYSLVALNIHFASTIDEKTTYCQQLLELNQKVTALPEEDRSSFIELVRLHTELHIN